ncbi:MAG: recombinase family protein [Lysinibacillus sp.]
METVSRLGLKVQELLKNVGQGKYQGILVIAYDRLGRGDKTDQGIIEKTFRDSDTLIITPKHTIGLNDEQGEMTADFEGFLARMEYRKIKGRLRDGLNRAVLEEKNMGTTLPFGYTKDKDHVLQIIPEEAKIVKMIFAKAIEGYGSHIICTHLHKESNQGIKKEPPLV